MNCHECAMEGLETPAVAICRFCMVGLCKRHLVESFRTATAPQYACSHSPGAAARVAPVTRATAGATGKGLVGAGSRN